MKVAVTSQGPDLNSEVDPRFGRARYFIVVDLETGQFATHDNSGNLNSAQGAGVQAGRDIAELGAQTLLTGNIGPKAFTTLEAAGITVYTGASGTVQDAIEQFKAGRLQHSQGANVPGRWT